MALVLLLVLKVMMVEVVLDWLAEELELEELVVLQQV
jgi:hypothetical protein